MFNTVRKIWGVISTIIVVLAVILAVLLVGTRLIGLQVFTVLSGSMEPEFSTGSIIYVKDVDPFKLEAGDIITFMLDEDTVATHRVVGIVPDDDEPDVIRFRTKGDANENEDGTLVHYKNVIGTPVFAIPYLGYLANYIQSPPGLYVAISAGAILLLLVFLPDLLTDDKEEEEKKKKKKKKGEDVPEADAGETAENADDTAAEQKSAEDTADEAGTKPENPESTEAKSESEE